MVWGLRSCTVSDCSKATMSATYDMKDLGELHFILGLQVKRDRSNRTLHLCQRQYVDSILSRFGFEECKPLSLLDEEILHRKARGSNPFKKLDQPQGVLDSPLLFYCLPS